MIIYTMVISKVYYQHMDSVNTKIIGFWRGWSIAVGCAIGSGIFMMPTLLAPYGLIGFGGWFIAGAGSVGSLTLPLGFALVSFTVL